MQEGDFDGLTFGECMLALFVILAIVSAVIAGAGV